MSKLVQSSIIYFSKDLGTQAVIYKSANEAKPNTSATIWEEEPEAGVAKQRAVSYSPFLWS